MNPISNSPEALAREILALFAPRTTGPRCEVIRALQSMFGSSRRADFYVGLDYALRKGWVMWGGPNKDEWLCLVAEEEHDVSDAAPTEASP